MFWIIGVVSERAGGEWPVEEVLTEKKPIRAVLVLGWSTTDKATVACSPGERVEALIVDFRRFLAEPAQTILPAELKHFRYHHG